MSAVTALNREREKLAARVAKQRGEITSLERRLEAAQETGIRLEEQLAALDSAIVVLTPLVSAGATRVGYGAVQGRVLRVIPRDDPMRLSDIGRAAGVSTVSASSAVAVLQKQGKVEKVGPGQYRRLSELEGPAAPKVPALEDRVRWAIGFHDEGDVVRPDGIAVRFLEKWPAPPADLNDVRLILESMRGLRKQPGGFKIVSKPQAVGAA